MFMHLSKLAKRVLPKSVQNQLLASRIGRLLRQSDWCWLGYTQGKNWPRSAAVKESPAAANPLREYFDAYKEGPGILKWSHYFDVYHRHFERFRGHEVHILEIGIYSGGSLGMWKNYFGPKCHVYGIDIMEACKAYEDESTKIFIGDQADRKFWKQFKQQVPLLDIVVDDGGHQPHQQAVTLEELLPHLQPGGVFLCEDVSHAFNRFSSYVSGLIHSLNDASGFKPMTDNNESGSSCDTAAFQSNIESIHCYPWVSVIEKRQAPVAQFLSPGRGSQWQPFKLWKQV
jgi:hypothetical protein